MCYILLLPPLIGMADNGDFERVIYPRGIYHLGDTKEEQALDFFVSRYGIYQYYNEFRGGITTTQIPFIQLALFLNPLFSADNSVFDIRALAFIMILYATITIYLLVDYVDHGKRDFAGYLAGFLSIYFFVDVGYIAYYNSFFAEGISFISFIFAITCGLLLVQRRYNPYLLSGLMFLNAIILTFAKQQNAPVGILFGILFFILAFLLTKNRQPAAEKQAVLKNQTLFRFGMIGASGILSVAAVVVYLIIPETFININKLHSMTRGAMMVSENPEKTLGYFTIDRQYALLNNMIYYERYPVIDVESKLLADTFYSKYGYPSLVSYYLLHSVDFFRILSIAVENGYAVRPQSLGNYEKSAGFSPGAKSYFFAAHSTIKQNIAPRTAGFLLIWLLVVVAVNWKNPGKLMVLLCAILIGLSQILVSIIGAGDADISKHLFLYNVAFDLINYLLITAGLSQILTIFRKKKA